METLIKFYKQYGVVYLGVLLAHILYANYLSFYDIRRDITYEGMIILSIGVSFVIAIFLTSIIFILSKLFKVEISYIGLFLLSLIFEIIGSILWEISYTGEFGRNAFTSFYYNNEYLSLLLLYLLGTSVVLLFVKLLKVPGIKGINKKRKKIK